MGIDNTKLKHTEEIFNKYATKYQEKYMDIALYKESFNKFIKQIKFKNAKILDLACGPGNITHYLLKEEPGYQIRGLDISKNMINLATTNNPNADFKQMDCREIYSIEDKFDGIMCGFCLPYFSKTDTTKLLSDSYTLLNKEGVIYISVMEANYNKSGWQGPSSGADDKLYIYYHEAKFLCQNLESLGFKITKLQRFDNPQQSDSSIKDLVIIAKKT